MTTNSRTPKTSTTGDGAGWPPPPPQYQLDGEPLPPARLPGVVVATDLLWLALCAVIGLGVLWAMLDPAPQEFAPALAGGGLLSLAGALGWFLAVGRRRYLR